MFFLCVFWQWEKTKDRRGGQAVSQMHQDQRELGKVTSLRALWGRAVGAHMCVSARAPARRHASVGGCANVWVVCVSGRGGPQATKSLAIGGVHRPFLHLTLPPQKLGQQNQPRAQDRKLSTLGDPRGRQRKARLGGQRSRQQNCKVRGTRRPSGSCRLSPRQRGTWGGWKEGWAGLARRQLLEFHPETPRTPPCGRWPLGSGVHAPPGGTRGARKRPRWHPCGRANLLTRACVASLLVPPVIL